MLIRPMTPTDLPGVLAVQQRCYPPVFHEPSAAFASKLTGAPDTCWVAACADEGIVAYLVSLPVDAHSLPVLHAAQWQAPAQAQWLYLHDLAVAPLARGRSLAPRLVAQAQRSARALRLRQMVLVAVQGSQGFWQQHGFAAQALPAEAISGKLDSFGPDAQFMACAL